MTVTDVADALPGGASLLRNEPVQARSSARLTGLLDAAAGLIDEIGYERLTTAMVAERAGASIGTVYRYFPDRIAVVDALALRCLRRLGQRFDAALAEAGDDWAAPLDLLVDCLVDLHRTEPGFRAVRFGERPEADGDDGSTVADQLATALAARADAATAEALAVPADVAVETAQALVAHAARGGALDEALVAECRRVLRAALEPVVTAR